MALLAMGCSFDHGDSQVGRSATLIAVIARGLGSQDIRCDDRGDDRRVRTCWSVAGVGVNFCLTIRSAGTRRSRLDANIDTATRPARGAQQCKTLARRQQRRLRARGAARSRSTPRARCRRTARGRSCCSRRRSRSTARSMSRATRRRGPARPWPVGSGREHGRLQTRAPIRARGGGGQGGSFGSKAATAAIRRRQRQGRAEPPQRDDNVTTLRGGCPGMRVAATAAQTETAVARCC